MLKAISTTIRSIFYLLLFSLFTFVTLHAEAYESDYTTSRFTGGDTISGVVKGTDYERLVGASIVIKGTPVGTVTDTEGQFTLVTDIENPILLISYLGYNTLEVEYVGQSWLELEMVPQSGSLQEVVVVGYGTQVKKNVIGAIGSISSQEISELSITNPSQVLQGQIAGVSVVSTGRNPGSGVNVRIRGRRSLSAGNEPIYVVDGMPLAGALNDINPNDIESMEVLKDAASTAIYGSRAANGVILITTKRGRKGEMNVSYNGYYGVSQAMGKIDMMNGEQYAAYKRESRRATGNYDDNDPTADTKVFDIIEQESLALGRSTDYQALIISDGSQQNHNVGISGGSENTSYYVSGGYFNDVGIIPGQDFTRYTLRVNLDQKIGKRLRVGLSNLTSYNITNNASNPMIMALANSPLGKPYNDDGSIRFSPTLDALNTNPLSEIVKGAYVRETKKVRSFNNVFAEYEILKGLKYRVNFGPDFQYLKRNEFTGSMTNSRRGGEPTARGSSLNSLAYTLEHILNYDKRIAGAHRINLLALYSIQRYTEETMEANVTGVPVETQESYNLGAAPIINGVGSNFIRSTLISYLGRASYDFRNRYFVTLTTRVDQSSRFDKSHRDAVFPSIALGWNISEENFLKGIDFLTNLKFRVSVGKTGNSEIRPYQTEGDLTKTTYAFGNNGAYGYRPNTFPNKSLKWETTTSGNIGLDFNLFSGRISGAIDLYQQQTNDLLMQKQLPTNTGFASILQNVGKTKNAGVELALSTVNLQLSNSFKWSTDINWFKNYEEIVELYGDNKNDVGSGWFIGEPITVYYDYEKIGIWQLEEKDIAQSYQRKPGEIKIKDQNQDGRIDAQDRKILGSDLPQWEGGMTNRFEFKGIDFSFFLFARQGGMIRSLVHNTNNLLSGRNNNLDVDYWTPQNPTNAYPRPNQNQEVPVYASSMTYFDGSFLKVRNITLGYSFSPKLLKPLKMEQLRIFASAQQPFIFAQYRSKYKGIDPEFARSPIGGVEQVSEIGAMTPSSRLIFAGLNVRF